jgi:hypothetical protein
VVHQGARPGLETAPRGTVDLPHCGWMFNIGVPEVVIILVVAAVVWILVRRGRS